jgi:hypothetical protein
MRPEDVQTIFKTAKEHGLLVSHPSVSRNHNHPVLFRDLTTEVRFTTWTELQAPVISKEALKVILDSFDVNCCGWGLPQIWQKLLGDFSLSVMDTVEIIHTKPYYTGSLYNGLDPYKELYEACAKYGIYESEEKELSRIYRNLISFVILYHEGDKHYLLDCLKSLPKGCEIVLCHTQQGEEDKTELIKSHDDMIMIEYTYKEWDFSKARNEAKRFANREWVFSLDADERLVQAQHELLIKSVAEANIDPEVYGLYNYNFSYMENYLTNGEPTTETGHQVRIFRRACEWYGSSHESIDRFILVNKKKINHCGILILHLGHDIDKNSLKEKRHRNIKGLIKTLNNVEDEMSFNHYYTYLLSETNLLNKLKG